MEQIDSPASERIDYRHYFAPRFFILILGIGLSIGCFLYLSDAESANAFTHIKNQNKQRALAIASSSNNRLVVLKSLRSHIQNHDTFTHDDFIRQTSVFLRHYPDILAIEWAPRIPDAFRRDFEAGLKSLNSNRSQILKYNPAHPQPSERKAIYFPIQYVMPATEQQAATGLDISSVAHWQDLLEKAKTKNAPVATAMTSIKTDDDTQTTIRIFYPVFDNEEQIKGYLSLVIKMDGFIRHALRGHRQKEIVTQLYDLGQHSKLPIYVWSGQQKHLTPANSEGPYFRETIPFADRQWLVASQPSSYYLKLHRSEAPRNMLLAGLLLTALAYISLHWSYKVRRKLSAKSIDLEQQLDLESKALENKIIEKRVLERALEDSECRCRDLISLSPDYVWESNTNYEYTYLSPQAAKIKGVPPKQLAGVCLLDCLIEDDRATVATALENAHKTQTSIALEVSFTTASERRVKVLLRALPMIDSLGEWIGFRGTGHKVS